MKERGASKTVIACFAGLASSSAVLLATSCTRDFDAPFSQTAQTELDAEPPGIVLEPTDDRYVQGNVADIAPTQLLLKNSTDERLDRKIYLKFDLSNEERAPVTSAILRMHALGTDGIEVPVRAYRVDDDTWTETTITWANAPVLGAALATVPVFKSGEYDWNVTTAVNAELEGDRTLSLGMFDPNVVDTIVRFAARESTHKLAPKLILIR